MNARARARDPDIVASRPTAARDIDSRRARLLLAATLALALVIRVVYVFQSRANPFFDEPTMDAQYHAEWARAFAAGRDFQPGPFFRAPLYPWFLGVCFRIFGEDYLWPRIVQALIGTLSCALVYAIGARAFDRRTGLLAAFATSTYWILVYFEGELLSPVLEVCFDLAAILLSLRIARAPKYWAYAIAGVAWGLAAIVRPNALLCVPFVAAWILFLAARERTSLQKRFLGTAAFVLGVLAPILPITAYNRFAGGDTVLIATNGGVNLWIGNNPEADGTSAIVPGTRADWWGGFYDSIALAESEEGRVLAPSDVDAHYKRKALRWMFVEEPVEALRLVGWKLLLFWKDWEIGNNQDERFFALRFGPILRFLPLGFAILASMGLVGFVLAARRWRELFPLWVFLPLYTASVVLFFVNARYRVPVLPVLAIFGAATVVFVYDALRARRLVAIATVVTSVAGLWLFVATVPAQIDRSEAYGWWQLGLHDAQHGDHAAAALKFEEAVRLRPNRGLFHQDLGITLARLGRNDEAEASFRRALEREPANAIVLDSLFELQLVAGRIEDARATADRLRERVPHYTPGLYAVGRVAIAEAARIADGAGEQARRGKREEALAAFDACLAASRDPAETFSCALGAGSVLVDLRRPTEAIERFERALVARPVPDEEGWYWNVQFTRLQALVVVTGDKERAVREAQDLVRRFAHDPRAAQMLAAIRRL